MGPFALLLLLSGLGAAFTVAMDDDDTETDKPELDEDPVSVEETDPVSM